MNTTDSSMELDNQPQPKPRSWPSLRNLLQLKYCRSSLLVIQPCPPLVADLLLYLCPNSHQPMPFTLNHGASIRKHHVSRQPID